MKTVATIDDLRTEIKEKLLNCEITAEMLKREDFKSSFFKDEEISITFQYNKDYIIK